MFWLNISSSLSISDFLRIIHNLKKSSSWFWLLLSKSADLSKPWGRFFQILFVSQKVQTLAEIQNYTLTRGELFCTLRSEIPCNWIQLQKVSFRWKLCLTLFIYLIRMLMGNVQQTFSWLPEAALCHNFADSIQDNTVILFVYTLSISRGFFLSTLKFTVVFIKIESHSCYPIK